MHAAQVRRNQINHARLEVDGAPPPALGMPDAPLPGTDIVRAPTVFSLWRKEAIRRDREMGTLRSPCSRDDWARRMAEWELLDLQELFYLLIIWLFMHLFL